MALTQEQRNTLSIPGNGVHAFGGELVQRREDRGGIVQTPHAVIQISQNGQSVALFLRKRHLNPLSSGPCLSLIHI